MISTARQGASSVASILCAVAVAIASLSPASAGQPIKLTPPAVTTTAGQPIKLAPPAVSTTVAPLQPIQDDPAAPIALEDPAKPSSEIVQVGALAEIDPSSVGLLDPGAGGLGVEMWRGSERSRIERLLQRLPMGTLSSVMQDLSRRLLLSTANVPQGDSVAPSFLGLRVERLAAGGQTAAVNQLLRLVSTRLTDPAFARAEMDGLLLGSDRAAFCTRIDGLVADDPDPYWLKGLAFCKALDGETEAVELAVNLLHDSGESGDEAFFVLAEALTGNSEAVVESLIDPTPLQLAMLRAARMPLPADAVAGARPGILGAEATWANADIGIRLEAAEKAEAAGVIGTQALAQIYAGIEFSEEELTEWALIGEVLKGPRANALLYQVALIESDPQVRTKALVMAWRRTAKEGGFATMARVTNNAARSLIPADELAWAATDIIRSLIAAGDYDRAKRWIKYVHEIIQSAQEQPAPTVESSAKAPKPTAVRKEIKSMNFLMGAPRPAPPPPERPVGAAAGAILEMWPLMLLADFDGKVESVTNFIAAWWLGQIDLVGPDVAAERAALLYTLFDALGYEISDEMWDPLLQGPLTVTGYLPSPALSRALAAAAADKRVGETVLLALLALGDVGPAGVDPSTLHAVIRALREIGLSTDARLIAIEAALGRNF